MQIYKISAEKPTPLPKQAVKSLACVFCILETIPHSRFSIYATFCDFCIFVDFLILFSTKVIIFAVAKFILR